MINKLYLYITFLNTVTKYLTVKTAKQNRNKNVHKNKVKKKEKHKNDYKNKIE